MLRVGSVPYLVGRPLDSGMESEPDIEFRREVPAKLVEGLRAGSIDVALVSSIELFRRPGYSYVDHLAVAGHGHVSSVQVFLRRELDAVRSIAMDPASRTAQALTQVVWPRSDSTVVPEFRVVPTDQDPRDVPADAWLRIGDVALQETREDPPPAVFNPSQAFQELTGLPFVFALWIVRPGIDVEPHLELFHRARERGKLSLDRWISREAESLALDPTFLEDYMKRECFFEPGEALTSSILAFRDAAAPLDLADGSLLPRAVGSSRP